MASAWICEHRSELAPPPTKARDVQYFSTAPSSQAEFRATPSNMANEAVVVRDGADVTGVPHPVHGDGIVRGAPPPSVRSMLTARKAWATTRPREANPAIFGPPVPRSTASTWALVDAVERTRWPGSAWRGAEKERPALSGPASRWICVPVTANVSRPGWPPSRSRSRPCCPPRRCRRAASG